MTTLWNWIKKLFVKPTLPTVMEDVPPHLMTKTYSDRENMLDDFKKYQK